jgi:hypothetical protein
MSYDKVGKLKMTKKEKLLSKEELDLQESLSLDRMKNLGLPCKNDTIENRPQESFINLVNWIEANFSKHLTYNQVLLNRLIHNRIIIDGEFLQFCDENNITVKCVYNDTIVSWNSDFGNEKFFMQGIFLIKKGDVEFLHCALLHKGNQNEDEISFLILVSSKNLEAYLSIRNDFDDWANKRDRSNLYIRVIGGDDIPYEKDTKWEDVFLPEDLKKNVRHTVEGFLKSKDIYLDKNIPWKKGILLYGAAGNGKTTCIKSIISNYDFKPITIFNGANDEILVEAFAYAEQQSPALLYFEDLDSLLQNINISLFLNLLDGVSTRNGLLVIATANSLDNLKSNIKDRPSRFDRKFEIPLPNQDMTMKYIKRWFGSLVKDNEAKELIKYTIKYHFSYAYLKELYISSIYNALADDRKDPTFLDVKLALEQLMSDKFKRSKSVGIDKYLTQGL